MEEVIICCHSNCRKSFSILMLPQQLEGNTGVIMLPHQLALYSKCWHSQYAVKFYNNNMQAKKYIIAAIDDALIVS